MNHDDETGANKCGEAQFDQSYCALFHAAWNQSKRTRQNFRLQRDKLILAQNTPSATLTRISPFFITQTKQPRERGEI